MSNKKKTYIQLKFEKLIPVMKIVYGHKLIAFDVTTKFTLRYILDEQTGFIVGPRGLVSQFCVNDTWTAQRYIFNRETKKLIKATTRTRLIRKNLTNSK